ncbi:DUF3592 domain-containing protein [Aeromicrobium sp. 50.2.37]|uniref:DUF3592 domain-containing protein n=1 Tax=Aeromicrobium sp. 50.2.37 TaxID=2969305 RepID=UPI00214FFCDE|nr:DUF3592 domain-containing protein [Aeromicrobium sp. 50.2.37]MCR4513535.1 DUF3592 domain-containing protein [Aeromicrobium sp. 50.2.37]
MSDAALVPLVAGGIPAVLGVVFLTIGLVRQRMTRGWIRTTGVVVDRRSGRADRGMTSIYPTFQWQDEHGQVHQHTSSVKQSLGPSPGTAVPVRYDPQRPSRGTIDTFVQGGRIFVYIGAGLLVVALVALVLVSSIVISL